MITSEMWRDREPETDTEENHVDAFSFVCMCGWGLPMIMSEMWRDRKPEIDIKENRVRERWERGWMDVAGVNARG